MNPCEKLPRGVRTALLAACGLAAAALAGCGRKPAEAPAAAPAHRVRVAPVQWSDAAIPVTAHGVVARKVESLLSFKIGGIVQAVGVRAGDPVKAGAVLATLDPVEIDAQVTRARAAVDKAQRDLARAERLEGERVATLEQVQDARTAVEMAEAAARAAEFNRRFAVITAPADGVILRRTIDPDELVEAGRGGLTFAADDAPWIVRAGLSERELAGIHPGSAACVRLTGGEACEGVVTQVAGVVDGSTRTIPVEIELRGEAGGLRSGFVAQVEIVPDAVARRAVVPLESLVAGDGRSAQVFLLAADGAAVRRVAVEVGALADGLAYLATPLPEGATVVTAGAEFLNDGDAVVVVR